METALPFLLFALAYANGANDVSKGIATLVGSGGLSARKALLWGAGWTFGGCLLAALLGGAILQTFSTGIVSVEALRSVDLPAAAACGAIGWVLLATRIGLPVSTTHSIVGAFCGAGLVSLGASGVSWTSLGGKVVLALLLSPVVAAGIALLLPQALFEKAGRIVDRCVCLYFWRFAGASPSGQGAATGGLTVIAGVAAGCPTGSAVRLGLPSLHMATAALVSLARAWNDTPKIVALGFLAGSAAEEGTWHLFPLAAAAMALGSYIGGLRVTRTMGERITSIDPGCGTTVNSITALLVTTASPLGLPLSTTHVSNGAIVGGGLRKGLRAVQWRTVGQLGLAWVVTVPAAALLAAGFSLLFQLAA